MRGPKRVSHPVERRAVHNIQTICPLRVTGRVQIRAAVRVLRQFFVPPGSSHGLTRLPMETGIGSVGTNRCILPFAFDGRRETHLP